jgi:hypothetical protein
MLLLFYPSFLFIYLIVVLYLYVLLPLCCCFNLSLIEIVRVLPLVGGPCGFHCCCSVLPDFCFLYVLVSDLSFCVFVYSVHTSKRSAARVSSARKKAARSSGVLIYFSLPYFVLTSDVIARSWVRVTMRILICYSPFNALRQF